MGSKSKKLAKAIANATKKTVSKKKRKKYGSVIDKYAKKVAKKLLKKKKAAHPGVETEPVTTEKLVEPTVWKEDTTEPKTEIADK